MFRGTNIGLDRIRVESHVRSLFPNPEYEESVFEAKVSKEEGVGG
jgi:hypothetical protein